MTATGTQQQTIGDLLRAWRERRRLSQLALALDAEVSTRHLSFLETGRAKPSREMVLRLAERLDVPLRERNSLLLAAGFAPAYPERALDDPEMESVQAVVARVLTAHEPYPALAVDRFWTLVAANRAVAPLLDSVAAELLRPPVNVLRLSLHPQGLAPRILNFGEWRDHVLRRLSRQVTQTGDRQLEELLRELRGFPVSGRVATSGSVGAAADAGAVAVPLRLDSGLGPLAFLSTTMIFGTPVDITVAELAIEAFFPADARTAEVLPQLVADNAE